LNCRELNGKKIGCGQNVPTPIFPILQATQTWAIFAKENEELFYLRGSIDKAEAGIPRKFWGFCYKKRLLSIALWRYIQGAGVAGGVHLHATLEVQKPGAQG